MSSNTEFVKWTEEDFCDRDTCYFCKTKNDGDWDESCEDAVCVECSDKWEYLDDYCGEGYYRECYDCGACDKCKEWNTDEEEWNTDEEEEEEEELDMKVLGFLTTDRLDGDWNSLLFEIRNHGFELEL